MQTPGSPPPSDATLLLVVLGVLGIANAVLLATGTIPLGVKGLGTIVAAGVSIGMYSFLYRDNALFKVAEHLYVGVSAGYGLVIVWYNVLWEEFAGPAAAGKWSVVGARALPVAFGLLMLTRLSARWGWLSRYSFAFVMGLSAGMSIPLTIDGYILKQLHGTIGPMAGGDMTLLQTFSQATMLVGVVSVLVYFFYSIEHKGTVGVTSRVGVYFLMVSFGASFGYTVMARLSLLVGQLQFLLRDWLHVLK